MRSLEAEKTHIYQQMTQIVDVKHKMEKELSELKTNKEMMDREIAKLKTCNDNMLREITDMKIDKDKMEEIFDQTKTVMLKELQSTRQGNEKLLKDKSEVSIVTLNCGYSFETRANFISYTQTMA